MLSSTAQSRRSGFSLTEVLLAMLVFVVAVGTILALLTRNIEMVNRLSMENEAMRLGATLEQRFSRQAQREGFGNFYASVENGATYYCYHYNGGTGTSLIDGEYLPNPLYPLPENAALGEDYIVVPSARPATGANLTRIGDEVVALDGTLFMVELERLDEGSHPGAGFPPVSATAANSAVIVIQASFYPVGAVGITVDPAEVDPTYEYILAVRR